MRVREAAFRVIETRAQELRGGLQAPTQVILRAAAARGMSGLVATELLKLYEAALGSLLECCIEQFAWECAHDPWPRRKRAEAWQFKIMGELSKLAQDCKNQYGGDTANILPLSQPNVVDHVCRSIDSAREKAMFSMFARVGTKDAEVDSAKVKSRLAWLTKGAISAISAVAGYFWHKYMG